MSQNDSDNQWLAQHLTGPDAYWWRMALKKMFLKKKKMSALKSLYLDGIEERDEYDRSNQTFPEEVKDLHTENGNGSVRKLVDFIITEWKPEYLNGKEIKHNKLHNSLIDIPCKHIQTIYDDSNIDEALKTYQNCFVPLLYHELWNNVISDYNTVKNNHDRTIINIQKINYQKHTAMFFGTNETEIDDPLMILSNKLNLFQIILIRIDKKSYFGVIVDVKINEIPTNQNKFHITLMTTVQIYVSAACATVFEEQNANIEPKRLEILEITNMKSIKSMINAVYKLKSWPQYRSLLNPTTDDNYFKLDENFDPKKQNVCNKVNWSQNTVINKIKSIFDDIYERLHIIWGPPGTGKSRTIAKTVLNILPDLGKKQLLLCAPSNKACDELLRRIVDECSKENIPCQPGFVIRVGCRAPDDPQLSEYFLDHLFLQELVKQLKNNPDLPNNMVEKIEENFVKKAKIIISTLNHCSSIRLRQLVGKVALLIVDEASQGLEPDLLIPLKFQCTKLILVGDPKQLSPTVLSNAGRAYNLQQSLYFRLYSIFKNYKDKSSPITMLITQYRMHLEICQFPSQRFYDGRLWTHSSVAQRMADFLLQPYVVYDLLHGIHEKNDNQSSYNMTEIHYIQRFCMMLVTNVNVWRSLTGQNSTEIIQLNDARSIEIQRRIAVITPYSAQVTRLQIYLPPAIDVMTADSSQGSEKDIIIISCVRGKDSIGFLDNKPRLNVMLTRAKYGLYIFGNITWLSQQDENWLSLSRNAHSRRILYTIGNSMNIQLPLV